MCGRMHLGSPGPRLPHPVKARPPAGHASFLAGPQAGPRHTGRAAPAGYPNVDGQRLWIFRRRRTGGNARRAAPNHARQAARDRSYFRYGAQVERHNATSRNKKCKTETRSCGRRKKIFCRIWSSETRVEQREILFLQKSSKSRKTRGGFFGVKRHVNLNEDAHLLQKMGIFIQISMPIYTKESASAINT